MEIYLEQGDLIYLVASTAPVMYPVLPAPLIL